MKKFFLYYITIISIIIGSIGCGKKSGVSGPDPNLVISFTSSGSPSDNSVYLEEVSKKYNEITLALKVKGGNNVFGAAMEITYDGSLLGYVSASEGTYLNKNGIETMFASSLNNGHEGILLIGCNRKGNAQGENGDGLLATIVLKAKANQTNTLIGFNAVNCALELPGGSSPKYIAGTKWLGGSLSYK
jgi:hypothetical protein